ncbi:MAG: alpha/beta hydrolase [Gemmatimonadetes bacterium]|nr:alpha/beta hydrolase [Gemmatimonadota bacterium]
MLGALRMHARVWASAPAAHAQPPIVLVHGLGVSSRYMIPTGERLAATHRVFAPDLPGIGRSDAPRRPYSIAENARALGDWMHECGLVNPVLVGNSYGCQVIAELLIQRPACAAALVLSSPTIENTRRSAIGESRRLLTDAPFERLALVPVVVGDYLRAGPRTILSTLRDAIADRIEDKLPRIAQPTLLVRGARDTIVSQEWIAYLAGMMPRAAIATLEGAAHAVNFSASEAFVAAILHFTRNELM